MFHLSFHAQMTQGCLAPPMAEVDSNDEEYLPTADCNDPAWSKEPVPDNQEYLCIYQISRLAT